MLTNPLSLYYNYKMMKYIRKNVAYKFCGEKGENDDMNNNISTSNDNIIENDQLEKIAATGSPTQIFYTTEYAYIRAGSKFFRLNAHEFQTTFQEALYGIYTNQDHGLSESLFSSIMSVKVFNSRRTFLLALNPTYVCFTGFEFYFSVVNEFAVDLCNFTCVSELVSAYTMQTSFAAEIDFADKCIFLFPCGKSIGFYTAFDCTQITDKRICQCDLLSKIFFLINCNRKNLERVLCMTL